MDEFNLIKSCLGISQVDNLIATNISTSSLNIQSSSNYNKVSFSNVASYDIPINLLKYSSIELTLTQYYTGTPIVNIYIDYNGSKFLSYSSLSQVAQGPIPVYTNNSNILFPNCIVGNSNGSFATIKLTNGPSGAATNIDVRGGFNWDSPYTWSRIDGSGIITGTGGKLTITSGTDSTYMTGSYKIKNFI